MNILHADDPLNQIVALLAYAGLYIVVLAAARLLLDRITPYNLSAQLGQDDNPAIGLTLGAYLLATSLIFLGALSGPSSGSLTADMLVVAGYAALGLVMLLGARWSFDKWMFPGFDALQAVVEKHNLAVASARAGLLLATGLNVGGSLMGVGGGPHSSLLFFLLGQASLLLFARAYDMITPYALSREIESGNTAAGVAFGGALTALGILIGAGVRGDFTGWASGLLDFVGVSLVGMALLLAMRKLLDLLLLPTHNLDAEISQDRNLAAGWVEACGVIGFALLLAALL
ncbi:DUF350 domain-containing protein [Magnetofaba australis]|uniref:DUF350 domain-containing protein n=1 Tax=Magnetofaba australis IT-1 TaxID=1434232 RepID=A0A1Y2K8U5_9PROT|nr:DUF350 domain-containing protein [Magnetofaba australis]OSM07143.1 hypothetical protein MAIT1_03942 [Magnetofaba australis IT-1]